MRAKLIIINWLYAFMSLMVANEYNPLWVAFLSLGWFGSATWFLNKYKKETLRELIRVEEWIIKQINKQPK